MTIVTEQGLYCVCACGTIVEFDYDGISLWIVWMMMNG